MEENKENVLDTIMNLVQKGKLEAMQLCDLSSHRLMYDIVVFAYRTDNTEIGPYVMLDYVYGATNYIPGHEITAILQNAERIYDALKRHNII